MITVPTGAQAADIMKQCLVQAYSGSGRVEPNPYVGAIIECHGQLAARGAHSSFGGPHAEVIAIEHALSRSVPLSESTLFVNLEPCCHFGKTPPCTDLILKHGIRSVVVGMRDPFARVSGKGIEQLKRAGVQVQVDVLEAQCAELNRRFVTFHTKKRPYIILKWAQTADGFMARADGSSKWISSEASRALVHSWRAQEMAIMVGARTARTDNPHLTARIVGARQPIRVVIDRTLSLDSALHLFDGSSTTIVFTEKKHSLSTPSVSFIQLEFGKDFLLQALTELYNREILSILIEGGSTVLSSMIENDLWDEARIFISPDTFGMGLAAPKLSGQLQVAPQSLFLTQGQFDYDNIDGDRLCTYRNRG